MKPLQLYLDSVRMFYQCRGLNESQYVGRINGADEVETTCEINN